MTPVITIDELLRNINVRSYTPSLIGKTVAEGLEIVKFHGQFSEKMNDIENRLNDSDALALFDFQCMMFEEQEIVYDAIQAQDKLNDPTV